MLSLRCKVFHTPKKSPLVPSSSSSLLPSPTPRSSFVLLLPAHGHFFSSCSSRGLFSDSGVLTLSVRTIQVGRCRFNIKMSCCRSCFSSSIWVFSSARCNSKGACSSLFHSRRGLTHPVNLECNPRSLSPLERNTDLLDRHLDEVNMPCSESRAIPSSPSHSNGD